MQLSEQFSTLQGEGKYLGVPSYFIRTTGCNLRCAWRNPDGTTTLCDTPYTSWKPEKGNELNLSQVLETLKGTHIKHVVITGGEPTMQRDLAGVVDALTSNHYRVTVETNGTFYIPNMRKAFMSISPKLKNSYAQPEGSIEAKMHASKNQWEETTRKWMETNDYQLKFVYNGMDDVEEILDIQKRLKVPQRNIYLMPQGITTEQFQQKQKELFQICLNNGWNYTPRMHVDIFGNKRGI